MQINCLSRDLKYAAGQNLTIAIVHNCRPTYLPLFTSSNKGGGKCVCPRLFVCLLARLLKNACMDLDDLLRVDRCRDMDELINF